MTPKPTIVTEAELSAFRAAHLGPGYLLDLVERERRVLLRLPVGVGKTTAIVNLLTACATYSAFDLVVYAAPTWKIVDEVRAQVEAAKFPIAMRVMRARPRDKCGALDADWVGYEQFGCGILARDVLCAARCARFEACPWPYQLRDMIGVRLVFMTEQRLTETRTIVPLLKALTKAKRVLVILDECATIDGCFRLKLSRIDLERFAAALQRAAVPTDARGPGWAASRDRTVAGIERVLAGDIAVKSFAARLNRNAREVQRTGRALNGPSFRYIGYDLVSLGRARADERYPVPDGIEFIARPYLGASVLMASATLEPSYAGHRLREDPPVSPFGAYRFMHTGTQVFNVTGLVGAAKYFQGSIGRVLGPFAVMLAKNIVEGQSTVLVSRKKTKGVVAEYLRERLHGWGLDVQFVPDDYGELSGTPDPKVVPILHYGILGVNQFEEYDALYCVNSYYISDSTLTSTLTQCEPEVFGSGVGIRRDDAGHRQAVVDAPTLDPAVPRGLAQIYLAKLEVAPVVQVVGRVRPITRARDVVTFQAADVSPHLPGCREVRTLSELLDARLLPSAKALTRIIEARALKALRGAGWSVAAAATALGISERSAYRRLAETDTAAFLRLSEPGTLARIRTARASAGRGEDASATTQTAGGGTDKCARKRLKNSHTLSGTPRAARQDGEAEA